MEDLVRKTLAIIRSEDLFRPGDTVVVGVSGGPDSVALLDVLVSLRDVFPLVLVVAHLNHLLRGLEADADEDFVRRLAGVHDLPFYARRVRVADVAAQSSLSLEEAARECRYAFFAEVVQEVGAAAVAVAHHADDQAETLLIRLVRGAGTQGLSAMRPQNDAGIVRPFLSVPRDEIHAHVVARGLAFRVDDSNADLAITRNRVRHEIMPLLRSLNPAIVRTLCATADILAADDDVLDHVVQDRWRKLARVVDDGVRFDLDLLRGELAGLRLRLYREAIAAVAGGLRRISRIHLDAIDRLFFCGPSGGTISLPGGLAARRCYSLGIIELARLPENLQPTMIDGDGCYRLSCGREVVVSTGEAWGGVPVQGESFSLAEAPFPWVVRYYEDGDRFVPFGRKTPVKLKDFFINAKIPRPVRRRVPLLVDASGRIIWVCGIRRSNNAPIAESTSKVVNVQIRDESADLLVKPLLMW